MVDRLRNMLTIDDLRERARRRVPKMFFDYSECGSWSEQTFRENVSDFSKIYFKQKVAVDLTNRSLKTSMVGQDVAMPVALAPVGLVGMQHADGEVHVARAAEKFGIPFALSTMSICSIEEVRKKTKKPFWFQLYVMRDRDFINNLIDRAKAANCSALVLTMDLQILAQRHKDLRNGMTAPPKFTPKHIWQVMTRPWWALGMLGTRNHGFGNVIGHVKGVKNIGSLSEWTANQFDPKLNWSDVAWIKERFGGKLIIKGIMTPEDARAALDTGADAIIVSNHGGRQLDGAPSSIRVLSEIVAAVGDQIEVHMDGGIRSGQDVLRAKALGAHGTWIGRPFVYGVGAGGEAGVTKALDIIAKELDISMALCGERDIRNVGPHNIYSTDWSR